MRFTKMHGLGNDFVVVDGLRQALPEEKTWPGLARSLCERRHGIGADGLVFVLPAAGGVIRMRIFNPDGSEAEMCGNAIRCVAKYACEHLGLGGEGFLVETLAGPKEVRPTYRGGRVASVTVNMGEPVLEAKAIPVVAPASPVVDWPLGAGGHEFRVTCVSLGNPHCVIFTDAPEAVELERWGPALERHPAFPRRTNVEFVRVVSPDKLAVRVWERGAGATMACGTGACAAAVAGVLAGVSAARVTVSLPGGDLRVWWEGPGSAVWLEGPAVEVFRGETDLEEMREEATCPGA